MFKPQLAFAQATLRSEDCESTEGRDVFNLCCCLANTICYWDVLYSSVLNWKASECLRVFLSSLDNSNNCSQILTLKRCCLVLLSVSVSLDTMKEKWETSHSVVAETGRQASHYGICRLCCSSAAYPLYSNGSLSGSLVLTWGYVFCDLHHCLNQFTTHYLQPI